MKKRIINKDRYQCPYFLQVYCHREVPCVNCKGRIVNFKNSLYSLRINNDIIVSEKNNDE